MKTRQLVAALSALLVTMSCTEQETLTGQEPGGDESAALAVSTGVLTTETKAVVGGEAITYAKANYATDAPGLGVVVLNSDGTAPYTDKGGSLVNDHIWFIADEKGENWKSISDKGADLSSAVTVPYSLTDAEGTVYAYYPKAITVTGTTATALTVPATLQTTGTITLSEDVSNADLMFDAGEWSPNIPTSNKKKILAALTETDYLYANNKNRTVSNGRAEGSAKRSIDLMMAHALSMVSFRIYNDGTLPGAGVLKKIVIQNAPTQTLIKTSATAVMELATGVISGLTDVTANKIERDISGYTIPSEIKSGQQSSTQYIVDGTSVTGPKVARKVSMLVYPVAKFAAKDIEAVFSIDSETYTVALPVTEVTGWVAGTNYLYTVCASQRKLEVTSVSVVEWYEESAGHIEL